MEITNGEARNVLVSAYACTPHAGSEPGVGFETVRAIVAHHRAWVLTRRKNLEPLRDYFANELREGRLNLIGVDLSPWAMSAKKRLGPLGLLWYYDRWQVEARRVAGELARTVHFDLGHHVTFASDWARAGIAAIPIPVVWGPIGGGVNAPLSLYRALGWRGAFAEFSRSSGRTLLRQRMWYRRAWHSVAMVLLQNRETATLARGKVASVIVPNSTAILTSAAPVTEPRTSQVLVVGRLIPWKGGWLALHTLRRLRNQAVSLHFLGDGPDLGRLQRLTGRLGLAKRVFFEGSQPRSQVLSRLARAAALLHPAVHDESPVTVGEALSLGTPVICLDHGGPPELLRRWPNSPGTAVPVADLKSTVELLADALDRMLDEDFPMLRTSRRPQPPYAESILAAYEMALRIGIK